MNMNECKHELTFANTSSNFKSPGLPALLKPLTESLQITGQAYAFY